jgi:hypothetical protein
VKPLAEPVGDDFFEITEFSVGVGTFELPYF